MKKKLDEEDKYFTDAKIIVSLLFIILGNMWRFRETLF